MNKASANSGYILNCSNGSIICTGTGKNYISKVAKGTKVGVLVDMYQGRLKFFINNIDQGWAIEN